jgi:hypothetical protein
MISKKKREKIIDKLKTAKGCETSHKRRRIENNLGTSGHAAIGGVTKSVHMEPVEPGLSLEMLPVTVVGPYISTNKANGFEASHKRRRIEHEESKKKSAGNYHLPLERTRVPLHTRCQKGQQRLSPLPRL